MSTHAARIRHSIVAVTTAGLLALSCINAPDIEVIRAADYGPGVSLREAQARVQNELGARVTHPDTASSWEWTPLRRGWAKVGVFGNPAYGWILGGSATYQNLIGCDSHRKLFCLFHDGDVIRMWDGTESNVVWGYVDAPDESFWKLVGLDDLLSGPGYLPCEAVCRVFSASPTLKLAGLPLGGKSVNEAMNFPTYTPAGVMRYWTGSYPTT